VKITPEPKIKLSHHVREAIDHAIGAGACRVAGRMNPACAATWNAVADAKSRQAKSALAEWMRLNAS
jgi:hypothetical protein